MAMQIHKVKGRHVNSYIIEETHGLAVVDVSSRGEKYVLGYIRDVLHRNPEAVTLVLCTHGDPDHSGGVMKLAAACKAHVAIPYATWSPWRKLLNDPAGIVFRVLTTIREAFRPRAWAMYASPRRDAQARLLPAFHPELIPEHEDFDANPDFRLQHGCYLPGFPDWRVVHTPGHSWDSCCFLHEPSRALISGDTLLGSAKMGRLVTPSILSNHGQMKSTIKHLKSLNPLAVYPGHGSVIKGENLLEHL